jgi:hypothetical protein
VKEPKREARRKKVVERIKTVGARPTPEEVGCSRMTLWRDLTALEQQGQLAITERDRKEMVIAQYEVLLRMEKAAIEGELPPEVVNSWNKVRESIAKLLGLNAATKTITARIDVPNAAVQGAYVEFNKLVCRKMKSWDKIAAFIASCPDDEEGETLCLP